MSYQIDRKKIDLCHNFNKDTPLFFLVHKDTPLYETMKYVVKYYCVIIKLSKTLPTINNGDKPKLSNCFGILFYFIFHLTKTSEKFAADCITFFGVNAWFPEERWDRVNQKLDCEVSKVRKKLFYIILWQNYFDKALLFALRSIRISLLKHPISIHQF